ncbi:MAG: PaaI family thioesterase [Deltaproteobacteria bacterium]|nr:PaaI family thioesterase [Deltaproteobacteria bacterium]
MGSREVSVQSFLRKLIPFYDHVGLTIESARDGVYRCSIPLNDETKNHFDTVHAAIQWASAEVLGGIVVAVNFRDSRLFVAVRSLTIDFLRPARTAIIAEVLFPDERVEELRSELEARGEVEFDVRAIVRDASQRDVATTIGRYVVRKQRESPRQAAEEAGTD